MNSRVLLLATSSYAGLGPYVISIINSFNCSDNLRFFLIESNDQYYTRNIKKDLLPFTKIIRTTRSSRLKILSTIIKQGQFEYTESILEYCRQESIEIIHTLTPIVNENFITILNTYCKVLCTVHDLYPHESKKKWFKKWRQQVLNKRVIRGFDKNEFLLTNSLSQLAEQKKIYPNKVSFYVPFPTLVTEEIKNGKIEIPELKDITNYLLFFGRIEEYKGIDLLIKAFNSIKNDYPDLRLVIAGKGELTHYDELQNIILIQRYIDDKEIANLYSNAKAIVYPYISATQSGVLSLALFFGKPMILSDVPFFKEYEFKDLYFKQGDPVSLIYQLRHLLNGSLKTDSNYFRNLYQKYYSDSALRDNLIRIYNQISSL